jgi:hypothetical protein
VQYLGTAVADGVGNWSTTFAVGGLLSIGQSVSAIAIDGSNNTSEFGANATVVAGGTIAGTIYHDVDGDANVAEGGTLSFSGATVRIFRDDNDGVIDAGDTLVETLSTNGSGQFTSSLVADGTYWVAIDSTTLTSGVAFNLGYDASWIWAEQTYGDDASTAPLVLGARFGGLNANTSDGAAAASPVGSEHVSRVAVSGANVGGVDSGFSFNAVVTTDDGDDVAGNRTVQGSLRQFLLNSNAIAGTQSSNFSINYAGGGGLQSIQPSVALLPNISDTVVLDATTQEGFSTITNVPIIELDGTVFGAFVVANTALTFDPGSAGSTVRGFVINRWGADAMALTPTAGNIVIQGNYIGTDVTGMLARPNGDDGIDIDSSGNTIGGLTAAERNVISGNRFDGIVINRLGAAPAPTGNVIIGNYIGTNALGTGAVGAGPEQDNGIRLRDAAFGNTIGGTAAGARNIISGNRFEGIIITNTAGANNLVLGNYIGTDVNGAAALGNGVSGLLVQANSQTIGGTAANSGNVISQHRQRHHGRERQPVAGNTIGLNAAGNPPLNTQIGC